MLVLTRRIDQTILIGDPTGDQPPLEVVVVEVKGDGNSAQVRLGITAPRELPVHRKEIWLAIQEENKAAA